LRDRRGLHTLPRKPPFEFFDARFVRREFLHQLLDDFFRRRRRRRLLAR
jgi:hypothetical protein